MFRFFFHRALLLILIGIILFGLFVPIGISQQTLGWSGVTLVPTHAEIDERAYLILQNDQAKTSVKFPTITDIKANDYVQLGLGGKTGPGPDLPGSSRASDHYYNPRQPADKAGNGPTAVRREYENLVKAMSTGNEKDASHAASWLAHFIADLYMPYHVQGMPRKDAQAVYNAAINAQTGATLPGVVTGPLVLSLQEAREQSKLLQLTTGHDNNFLNELEAFLNANPTHSDTEDWFDPWYWDGKANQGILAMELSSHIQFEGFSWTVPDNVSGYHSLWSNANVSFDYALVEQANQIENFAKTCAQHTWYMVDAGASNLWTPVPLGSQLPIGDLMPLGDVYLEESIKAAATVWRASFTALLPSITIDIPDSSKPQELLVQGIVQNTARESVDNVQMRITVSGGTLKSGGTEDIEDIGNIASFGTGVASWEVKTARVGYCSVKIEVIGRYYQTPDLQYAVTEAIAPGVVPVTVDNPDAELDHSIVFCLDNSGSMDGQPIIDARSAGIQAVNAVPSSGVEMALYFFGVSGCDVNLIQDFTTEKQPLIGAMNNAVAWGSTPLAAAITEAGQHIKSYARGRSATIILLTDGEETCYGDPVAAARALNTKTTSSWSPFLAPAFAASDIQIKLEVVGFNITSPEIEHALQEIAQAGNGNYYSATGVNELTEALTEVIKKSSGGIQIELWWLIAGGALILFLLVIILVRRRPVTKEVALVRQVTPVVTPRSITPIMPSNVAQYPVVLFCSHCSAQIQSGAAFCIRCGNAIAVSVTPSTTIPPQAVQIYCPHCGVPNPSGSVFCNKCGSAIHLSDSYRQEATSQKIEKKSSWAWWLLPLFLAIIGGLIAWSALRKKDPSLASRMLMLGMTITALLFWGLVSNL